MKSVMKEYGGFLLSWIGAGGMVVLIYYFIFHKEGYLAGIIQLVLERGIG